MTPRTSMLAFEASKTIDEVWEEIKTMVSRIPIYEETIDNIVGILYVKDLLEQLKLLIQLLVSKILQELLTMFTK